MLSSDEFDRRFDAGEDIVEYNAETLAAIQEAEDIAMGKIQAKSYKTVAEMEADLDAEEDE